VKSLVAVFAAPIILVGLPVNKGLRGYWFFPDRTNNSTAEDYSMDAPEGKWTGRLDGAKWGLSSHLSCLFTDIATQKKYRLRVFNQAAYKPSEGGPAFDGERAGGTYEITTRKNKNGLAVFLAAQKLS
jgi:hypothetical protein